MNHKVICVAIVLAGLAVAGCGPSTGYIVKPIPADERLTETTISTDGGLFVSDKVAVIDLEGMLMNQRDWSLFSGHENPMSLFLEKVDRAAADPAVKAVVLRINSPGGGVTASEILHKHLADFRASKKVPVVAIIEDVGASGAYYVACGADTILAHPTSIAGSIGVIMETVSFSGTMHMLGIEAKAVTSGPMKEMGSPFKPLDANDRVVLQVMVDEFYKGFIDVVVAGRPKLTREQILKLADGRVYSGLQAKANGLVDDVGFVEDAIALAKKKAGVTRAKVIMYSRPWGYRATAYSDAPQAPATSQFNMINLNAASFMGMLQPQFLYLWTGRSN
jgi:protease-4